jgi:hypothetical protein
MKTLKTFNLDQDTIRLVRTKPNQSTFVDRAIRFLHNKEEEFDIRDIPTRQLMAALCTRDDLHHMLKMAIQLELQETK